MVISVRPAVAVDGDEDLRPLEVADDLSDIVAAGEYIAVPWSWLDQVTAGQVSWAALRCRMPGVTFGASLRIETARRAVVYRVIGSRGPRSAVWLAEQVSD